VIVEQWVWAFIELSNAFIEVLLIQMFISAFLKEKRIAWKISTLVVYFSASALRFISNYFLHDNIGLVACITVILVFSIAVINYSARIRDSLLAAGFFFLVGACSELIAGFIVTATQSVTMNEVTGFTLYRFQSIIIMDLIQLIVIKLYSRVHTGKLSAFPTKLWFPLFTLPVLSIFITVQVVLGTIYGSDSRLLWVILSIVALVFINILMFALTEMIIHRSDNDKQYAMMVALNTAQYEHILLLTENQAQIRQMAHDFKHSIEGFSLLCETGNYAELQKGLKQLSNMQDVISPVVNTGNAMFDAVLSTKIDTAKRFDINITQKISIPSNLSMLTVGVCAIIGNALDNAIEACCRANSASNICIEIKVYNTRFLCEVKNTLAKPPEPEGAFLKSSKPGVGHGIGLKSMTHSCRDLGGELYYDYDDDAFILRISLPITG
jgi:hypothetical protein